MGPDNYKDIIHFIQDIITPEKSFVIDLGCNRGWLAGYFHNYLGLDNNVLAIEEAKEFWSQKLKWSKEEAEKHFQFWDANLPAQGNWKADIVICKDLIEHINNGHDLLKWIKQILKPNGYLLLVSPDSQKWVWNDPTHLRPFPRQAHRSLAKAHGYKIVQESFESVMPGTQIVASIFNGRSPLPVRIMTNIPWWPRNIISLMQI